MWYDVRPGQVGGGVEVGHGAAIPHRCRVAGRPEIIDRSVDGVSDAACSEFGAQTYFAGLDCVFARELRASYRRVARLVDDFGCCQRGRFIGMAGAYGRPRGNVVRDVDFAATGADRKRVAWGKGVSVRVDLAVGRPIKKKK